MYSKTQSKFVLNLLQCLYSGCIKHIIIRVTTQLLWLQLSCQQGLLLIPADSLDCHARTLDMIYGQCFVCLSIIKTWQATFTWQNTKSFDYIVKALETKVQNSINGKIFHVCITSVSSSGIPCVCVYISYIFLSLLMHVFPGKELLWDFFFWPWKDIDCNEQTGTLVSRRNWNSSCHLFKHINVMISALTLGFWPSSLKETKCQKGGSWGSRDTDSNSRSH